MGEVPAVSDDLLGLEVSMPNPDSSHLVFVLGCARSGTSILGETLAAHPGVHFCFEDNLIWDRAFPDRVDDRLTAEDARACAVRTVLEDRMARIAAEADGATTVDKNPKHTLRIGFLAELFPEARFVHIIRDGRDAVSSLMFRNRGGEWGHLKIAGWSDLLERFPEKNHVRCAHQWRDSVRAARHDGQALGESRYGELRFEALVENALETMQGVLDFIGLPMTTEVEEAAAKIQNATAGSYHAKRQVRHFVDDHATRVGRHRENLSDEQLAEIMDVCGELLGELGYE